MNWENLFRPKYRKLTPSEEGDLFLMKQKAEELLTCFKRYDDNDPRSTSLAVIKLEEAVMWATKAITR